MYKEYLTQRDIQNLLSGCLTVYDSVISPLMNQHGQFSLLFFRTKCGRNYKSRHDSKESFRKSGEALMVGGFIVDVLLKHVI